MTQIVKANLNRIQNKAQFYNYNKPKEKKEK